MTSLDDDLRTRVAQLRVDVELISRGKLTPDLSDSERIRMEAKRIAAHHIEKVANDHRDHGRSEYAELLAEVGNDNWHRGRLVGIDDAIRVLEVRTHLASWWQRRILQAVRASLGHLRDNTAGVQ